MATYYVGAEGNDANSGLSWATRLATLNGAEDKPVVAGDTVYVGPGVYRELLTIDVSGAAGIPITYIGDVTGEHTDGVGGIIRITGSDNDQIETRAYCITGGAFDYRTFRGFHFDMTTTNLILANGAATNWIIEDCAFQGNSSNHSIYLAHDDQDSWTIRRCVFIGVDRNFYCILFSAAGGLQDSSHLVENCIFVAGAGRAVGSAKVGGLTVRNCLVAMSNRGVHVSNALPGGYTAITVNNCIIVYNYEQGLAAAVLGEIVENFNTLYGNNVDRSNVAVGGGSQTYPPLFQMPLLHAGAGQLSGFRMPWWFGSLSEWSQVKQIAGTQEPDVDLFGIQRPDTETDPDGVQHDLCSWGAVQWFDAERSIADFFDGSTSMVLHDCGSAWMFVPRVSATSTTISARVKRGPGYTGQRLPEMIIKQPGQTDRRTVDTGAVGAWNLLTDTFTPGALPPWLVVELRSNEGFMTLTTTSSTTATGTSTSTITVTVVTVTTTTVTLASDVFFDALNVA